MKRILAGTLALTIAAVAVVETSALLSFRDEKLSIPGVGNFGRLNSHLYRGAQPTPEGFRNLAGLGVQVVVRLSLGEEGAAAEAAEVSRLGMESVTLPWSVEGEPDRDEIVRFLQVLGDERHRVVFVHCKQGADRTGVMIAMSRIALDGWTPDRALQEMRAFRYQDIFRWHMRALVQDFPARLLKDPGLVHQN